MNIVPKEKLEMWCSDECAERAMYIRVQLAEEPVWERRADDTRAKNILLLEEARAAKAEKEKAKGKGKDKSSSSTTVGQLAGELDNMHMEKPTDDTGIAEGVQKLDIRDENSRANELAMERGDFAPASRAGRVDVQIRELERVSSDRVKSPELRQEDREGGSIEGYVPKVRQDVRDTDEDMKEDLLDQF